MNNDKGFTLIELIVVIAIIGILTGVMSYSINAVSATRAEKAAGDLNALISQCRVETLSGAPSPTYLKLHKESDGLYGTLYEGGAEKTARKLGGNDISCAFTVDGGDPTSISETRPLSLAFDRSTGACMKLGDIIADATQLNSGVTGDYCTDISVASNGGSSMITLVAATGYHSISRGGAG